MWKMFYFRTKKKIIFAVNNKCDCNEKVAYWDTNI